MQPTLCCWNFTSKRLQALQQICKGLHVRLRIVGPGDVTLSLARLPQTAPAVSLAPMPFPDEMLLLVAFSDALVDSLLAGLRTEGLAPVRYKAILTPFNMGWNSLTLWRELAAEDAAIRRPRPRAAGHSE